MFKELLNALQQDPHFILVMGSAGSGKNYIAKQNLANVPLVDIDKYMADFASGGGDERKFISNAVHKANAELKKYFENSESVLQVTTGANYKGASNKLKLAKSYGLKTAVIYVDAGLNTSIKRNQDRAVKGDQRLVPDWKVEKTYTESKKNFKELKQEADISFKVRN